MQNYTLALWRVLDKNKRGASRRDQAPAETKRNDRQTATPSDLRQKFAMKTLTLMKPTLRG